MGFPFFQSTFPLGEGLSKRHRSSSSSSNRSRKCSTQRTAKKMHKKNTKSVRNSTHPPLQKINLNNNDKLNSIRKRWHLQCFTAITMRQSAVMGRLVGHKTAEIRQMPLLYFLLFLAESFGIDSADIFGTTLFLMFLLTSCQSKQSI